MYVARPINYTIIHIAIFLMFLIRDLPFNDKSFLYKSSYISFYLRDFGFSLILLIYDFNKEIISL